MDRAKHVAYDAARYANPAWRAVKLAQNAKYKATTPGILSEERHYQKRIRGNAANEQQV